MDVTPTPPQTRPTRGKSGAAQTAAAPLPKTASKSARRRKAAAEQPETTELPTTVVTTITEELSVDLNQQIATTAYFLAAARNFEPGHELEDWLQAERQVRTPS